MGIYLIIFAITAALLPSDRLNLTRGARFALLSVPFALLILMAGTRFETGNDWEPYYDYYQSIATLGDKAEDFEIGYRLLAFTIKSLGVDYSGFLFISTLIYMSAFFVAFHRQRGVIALALLFYCTYLLGWMGTARQVLALGLTVCAAECLLEGRRTAFVALVAIAATFHQTALLFLLAWFLRAPLLTTRAYVLLTAICIVLGQTLTLGLPFLIDRLTGVDGIGEKVVFYGQVGTEELNQVSGNVLAVLWYVKRLVFLGLFLVLRDKYKTPRLAFYFNAYFVSVAFFLVLDPTVPILAARGANYFSIYELFLLAALATSRARLAALAVPLVILLAGQRLYTGLYAYHPDLYIPYKGLFIHEDFHRNVH